SREIARVLGGEIRVRSTQGEGSTFTLYLPVTYPSAGSGPVEPAAARPEPRPAKRPTAPPSQPQPEAGGDYGLIRPGERVLLIVERDPAFANILLHAAHEQG